jgi:hypothetical protein
LETIAAIHRLVAARLKWHFRYAAALAARGLEHFTVALAAARRAHLLARLPAIRTTVGLILKTFGGVELLLSSRECELTSTVNTVQTFIDVH